VRRLAAVAANLRLRVRVAGAVHRIADVDERLLENLDKGVLYRVRR